RRGDDALAVTRDAALAALADAVGAHLGLATRHPAGAAVVGLGREVHAVQATAREALAALQALVRAAAQEEPEGGHCHRQPLSGSRARAHRLPAHGVSVLC